MTENTENGKERLTGRQWAKIIAAAVLLLLANYIFFLMLWVMDRYDDVQFDQILYQIKSPIAGTGGGLIGSALFRIIGVGTIVAGLEVLAYLLLAGKIKALFTKLKKYAAYSLGKTARFFKRHFMPISASALVLSILTFVFGLNIHAFIGDLARRTDFIEEHYVDPEDVEIAFEGEKRNLIFIFLESMETTFGDTSAGGKITADFIPELTQLARDNISFAGADGISGAYSYVGTRWTAASMFAQTSGTIVKVPLNFDKYGRDGVYMPGIVTLGDILAAEGYNQSLLVGSDANFAAREAYFKEHGNYKISDIYTAIDEGKIPEDYWEWWGYEDSKLFEYAKEEVLRLAELGEPFNFTTLTADTHFPAGYECALCGDEYEEQYANVLACSSRQVYEFVRWIQEQPFYENTTIILSGDHLTMDPEFLSGIEEDYVRTTYNCIINSAVEPTKETGREFAVFDMFPTTLAAIGATIEGDRLGLGVNLFSDTETLSERYGHEKLDAELENGSDFYFEEFYRKKK